jgi:hypothetical protein
MWGRHSRRRIVPLIERRMTRFLWKIVQLRDGCWIVPTKRLITAILISGRISSPAVLFDPIKKMLSMGAKLSNRIPYEIPTHFLGSLYPLDASIYLTPYDALQSQNLLEFYEDQFGDHTLTQKYDLNLQQLSAEYKSKLITDMDLMDKFLGDYVEANEQINLMSEQLLAVIVAAAKYEGYPLVYYPDICERVLKDLGWPTHSILSLERQILRALPDNIVLFSDLKNIANSDAHALLSTLVSGLVERETDVIEPTLLEEAISLSMQQISMIGTPFEAIATDEVRRLPEDPYVPVLSGCMPADEVLDAITDDAAVRLHKNVCLSRCLNGSGGDIDLLYIYSSRLWLQAGNLANMMRMLGGFPAAEADIVLGRLPVS